MYARMQPRIKLRWRGRARKPRCNSPRFLRLLLRRQSKRNNYNPGKANGVKTARALVKSGATSHASTNRARGHHPDAYVFCDKRTGAVKFTVQANTEVAPPLDRIAGSLAVYCVAHYCSPNDLVIVVRADDALNESINIRALALLESAGVGATSVALSPREREVLRAVCEQLANKEIAYRLSISVRTVKFHVSALLSKFGVSARSQLCDFSTARMYDPAHVGGNAQSETAVISGGTHGNSCK
jgi:DNA-binding CsgD family transcriptional regulator